MLHQYFATPQSGGATRSYEMARRLAADGHDVHILTTDVAAARLGWRWQNARLAGFTVHTLPVPYRNTMRPGKRLAAFAAYALLAGPKAVQLGGDVVFATSTPLTVGIPGVIAARMLRRAMVFEVRDLWPEVPIALGVLRGSITIWTARALERFVYRNASRVIALSAPMADGVAAAGFPRARISVIPNGSDIDLFRIDPTRGNAIRKSLPWLGDAPLVLYAGSFGRVNGVGYMVRLAAAMLSIDPAVRFLAIGAGAEWASVERMARAEGVLGVNFRIWRAGSKHEVAEMMSAATVVTSWVIPVVELEANSANKVFDAFAAGKPIALNYGGWQAELLERSGAGVRLSPHDPAEAAGQLAAFMSDQDRVRRAGEASARLAATTFDRDLLYVKFRTAIEAAKPQMTCADGPFSTLRQLVGIRRMRPRRSDPG
jgi:glycosyltransferase involved in cell wall biosynthesis